ncbi:hypothetical protein [Bombilactobacillus mellifer]|uniref:hypothetical protein n=1 Tax=Bombilactobacillus mellifer TaxID=1218492 RepID=UPI0023F3EA99|nr:hypothetical protein [Bombilactobacillus mellifer]MCT6826949.1 hypothetical protein [Bombilactobacillus mellifer]
MKIAVQINDKDAVIGFASVYSEEQLQISGWQEVEADPNFNSGNVREWKVANGNLVKIASGLTPLQELQQANVNLQLQLNESLATTKQLQQASINQTLTQDALNQQLAAINQKLDAAQSTTTKEDK